MGDKFFEFLAARLFAESLQLPLLVDLQLSVQFEEYFEGFQTSALLDFEQLQFACPAYQDSIHQIYIEDLNQLKQGTMEPYLYVQLIGNN